MERISEGIITLPVSEWQVYKELRLRALQKEPSAFCSTYKREKAWSNERWQRRLQDVADNKSWILFAKSNGKLVGLIGGYRNEEDIQNHRVQIWGMYVDELYRRKGIARALIISLINELRKCKDIKVARLELNSDQEPAKRLYECLGFRKVRVESILFGDGLEHKGVIMEKPLTKN